MKNGKSNYFHYYIFNLHVASQLELPECTPAVQIKSSPDVIIRFVSKTRPILHPEFEKSYFSISQDEYALDLSPLAHFRVSKGREIGIRVEPEASIAMVRRYLLSRVFAVLLYQRQIFPMAGASLMGQNKGLFLVGGSAYARSLIPALFPDHLLSAYLSGIHFSAHVFNGYPHSDKKPLPIKSLSLAQFKLIEICSNKNVDDFELDEVKGFDQKFALVQNSIFLREVFEKISFRKISKVTFALLNLPMFRLNLPIYNLSQKELKKIIKDKLCQP